MQAPAELNPLVIIFGAGVALINILGGLVVTMALYQVRQIRSDIRSVINHFNDSNGVLGIFTRMSNIEGSIKVHKSEIEALKNSTMNKELLNEKLETIKSQNVKLEEQAKELYTQQRETYGRVSQIERNTRSSGKWPSGGSEGK